MKLAPMQWQGTARRLIDDVLKPHFLPAARIEAFQQMLVRRLDDAAPAFVLEAPKPDMRSRIGAEKPYLTKHDDKVLFGDRAPATAVFTYLQSVETVTPEKMAALLIHLPHHVFDLDKFTKWATLTNNIASAGWMTAHVFPGSEAGDNWESLSREELRKRTVRNLHPLNMFIFPNLNKSGTVFADDPRFHALIAETYAKHYGALYDSFLQLTGDQRASLPEPQDFDIDLSAKSSAPEGMKMESKDAIAKIEASQAYDLKLVTVNEAQGYHSRILDPAHLTRGLYDIKLEYKEKSGDVKVVGFYRLNLKDLYEKKLLPRDAKGVRLLIHRTADNGFTVAPKKTGPHLTLPI